MNFKHFNKLSNAWEPLINWILSKEGELYKKIINYSKDRKKKKEFKSNSYQGLNVVRPKREILNQNKSVNKSKKYILSIFRSS